MCYVYRNLSIMNIAVVPTCPLPCETRQEKLIVSTQTIVSPVKTPSRSPHPCLYQGHRTSGSLILPVFVRQNGVYSDFNFCNLASTAAVFAARDTNTPCWACSVDAMAETDAWSVARKTQDTNTVGCFAAEQLSKAAFVRFAKRDECYPRKRERSIPRSYSYTTENVPAFS